MALTIEAVATVFVSALIGGVIGGGAIAAVAYRALKDKLIGDLKEIFARRSDLNRQGERVNAVETIAVQVRERADQNADNVIRLQEAHQNQWRPMLQTLERITARLDKQENISARTLALVEALEKRLDRHTDRRP